MPKCLYGGTYRAANEYLSRFGVTFDFVDFRDSTTVEAGIRENTKLIFCETPANPTLHLSDLEAIDLIIAKTEVARILKRECSSQTDKNEGQRDCGAPDMAADELLKSLVGPKRSKERSIVFVVDSTFATPLMIHPMDYGADVVLHSTTKYFDGHNVTTGGAAISRFPQQHAKIAYTRNICGSIMDPQTAFYTLNSITTLPLRFKRQSDTAKALALFLEQHPKVLKVLYPGLDSHPQRHLAQKYHRDDLNGGLLGFEVKGGISAGERSSDCPLSFPSSAFKAVYMQLATASYS